MVGHFGGSGPRTQRSQAAESQKLEVIEKDPGVGGAWGSWVWGLFGLEVRKNLGLKRTPPRTPKVGTHWAPSNLDKFQLAEEDQKSFDHASKQSSRRLCPRRFRV